MTTNKQIAEELLSVLCNSEDNNLHKGAFQVLNGKGQYHKGFRLYESEDT